MVESAHQDLVFNRFRKQKELSAANGFNPKLNRAKTDYNQICGLRASHRAGPCKHWWTLKNKNTVKHFSVGYRGATDSFFLSCCNLGSWFPLSSGCIGRANNLKKHPRCERIVLQRPGFDWGVAACTRLWAPCRCIIPYTVYTASYHATPCWSTMVLCTMIWNTIHLWCTMPWCSAHQLHAGMVLFSNPHPSPRTIFWCTEQYSGFICTRVTQSSKTAPVWDPSYQWNMDVLI